MIKEDVEKPHLFIYNELMEEKKYLLVGYIVRPRGLKGVVKVKSTSYFASQRYKKGNTLYLYNEQEDIRIKVTANTHVQEQGFDFVYFKEYNDINQIEKYVGYQIQVAEDEVPTLPKNTYYFYQLEGLRCFDEEGNEFGYIKKVEDFTSQTSFRILLKNNKTILIPFVEFYVKKIDIENKKIIIHLIPGLID